MRWEVFFAKPIGLTYGWKRKKLCFTVPLLLCRIVCLRQFLYSEGRCNGVFFLRKEFGDL